MGAPLSLSNLSDHWAHPAPHFLDSIPLAHHSLISCACFLHSVSYPSATISSPPPTPVYHLFLLLFLSSTISPPPTPFLLLFSSYHTYIISSYSISSSNTSTELLFSCFFSYCIYCPLSFFIYYYSTSPAHFPAASPASFPVPSSLCSSL